LADLGRKPDPKTSLRLHNSEPISVVATTSKYRALERISKARKAEPVNTSLYAKDFVGGNSRKSVAQSRKSKHSDEVSD